jgi:hypothetical protein
MSERLVSCDTMDGKWEKGKVQDASRLYKLLLEALCEDKAGEARGRQRPPFEADEYALSGRWTDRQECRSQPNPSRLCPRRVLDHDAAAGEAHRSQSEPWPRPFDQADLQIWWGRASLRTLV